MSRSKSILLQVAFKEAADTVGNSPDELAATTQVFYDVLLKLHADNGIDITDDAPRKGGGGGNWGSRPKKELPAGVFTFTDAEGTQWNDYRPAKATGQVIAKHPDFKTTDNKRSEWLFKQDGTENAAASTLAQAADQMSTLVAPM